jgi:hypothetical protein
MCLGIFLCQDFFASQFKKPIWMWPIGLKLGSVDKVSFADQSNDLAFVIYDGRAADASLPKDPQPSLSTNTA